MKPATLFSVFSLALTVTATPIVKRAGDVQVFLGIISDIQDDTDALGDAIDAYTGGDGADVQAASDALVTTINDGVTAVNAQEELSLLDALSLSSPVTTLSDHVDATVDKVIAKKDLFVENCLGPAILEGLQEQLQASNDLATAITAKVPDSVKSIAAQLSSQISTSIQRGVDAYTGVTGCA